MVSVEDMMELREQRYARQQSFLKKYKLPQVCFTLNLPGPYKRSPLADRAFAVGVAAISGALASLKFVEAERQLLREPAGCTAFFVVQGEALRLKLELCRLEETHALGRLWDIDVLDEAGGKLNRQEVGYPPRSCIICGRAGSYCARSRAHSLEELTACVTGKMAEYFGPEEARRTAGTAVRALLWEALTTPKPGLVDRNNSGAHKDMNLLTFLDSALALEPFFYDAALAGMNLRQPLSELFSNLRRRGQKAEGEMLAATGGVNTHKGAISSMGVAAAAWGRLFAENKMPIPEKIGRAAAEMTANIFSDFEEKAFSQGKGFRLHQEHGINGIRGEVKNGFPTVLRYGLPQLELRLLGGDCLNDAGVAALLAIMEHTEDSNIVSRSDVETLEKLRRKAAELNGRNLSTEEIIEEMRRWDDQLILQNLSCGGSADLLALTYFFFFLCREVKGDGNC